MEIKMTSIKKSKILAGALAIFVVLPIWLYLLYYILSAVQASQLAWFLYWVYVPVALFVSFVTKLTEE